MSLTRMFLKASLNLANRSNVRRNHFTSFKIIRSFSVANGARSKSNPLMSEEQFDDFMGVFPEIVNDLTDKCLEEIPDVAKQFTLNLNTNIPGGKKNRGMITVNSYKLLEDPSRVTKENIRLANILGWCVELLQGHFLMLDDIVDNSETRRGSVCWYRKPEIGMRAITDGMMVEQAIYFLLEKYFKNNPAYVHLMELFHEATMNTYYGQNLDAMCLDAEGKPKLDLFTMERYKAIVKYKAGYYSFQLPVISAMYLVGIYDLELHKHANKILSDIGGFFQIQDDFLDCFGDPAITGKKGTDIQDGKCAWPVVIALERASPAQRRILESHYGKHDPVSVTKIKELYETLGIRSIYQAFEEGHSNAIRAKIKQIPRDLNHDVFHRIMDKLHKRTS